MADQALHPALAGQGDQRGYAEVDDPHAVEADEVQRLHSHVEESRHSVLVLEAAVEGDGHGGKGRRMGLLGYAGVDYCGDGSYLDDRTAHQLVEAHMERLACRQVQRLRVRHFAWHKLKTRVLRNAQSTVQQASVPHNKLRYEQHQQHQEQQEIVR